MLSEGQLRKFQELYAKNYGEQISEGEALRQAIKLLGLVKLFYALP